jgi:hypothetical protein
MSRITLLPLVALFTLVACGDITPTAPPPLDLPEATPSANARERLAARLAVALNDPELRRELADRLEASTAPEGKLQFQTLAKADGNRLLSRLATAEQGSVPALLADLTSAHALELYLPVPAHRSAWRGGDDYLVATIGHDGEAPVAFDPAGNRRRLSPSAPPAQPVIALVPQEHDFARGAAAMQQACFDGCAGDLGGSDGGGEVPAGRSLPPGLYLSESHFNEDYESWLKGSPEWEFHVYGEVDGESKQLSCTGELANGAYRWDTDDRDWSGEAALLTEQDITQYLGQNPSGVIRIVAWEDDDEMCVPRTSGTMLKDVLTNLDEVYQKWTGAKINPWLVSGAQKAYAAWGLASAVHNWITTEDDLIGFGIEASIAGWEAGSANFALKGRNVVTTGSFGTVYRK